MCQWRTRRRANHRECCKCRVDAQLLALCLNHSESCERLDGSFLIGVASKLTLTVEAWPGISSRMLPDNASKEVVLSIFVRRPYVQGKQISTQALTGARDISW